MTFPWDKIKEFIALPEEQKQEARYIIVFFVLCGVVSWLVVRYEKISSANNQCVENCAVEKLHMQQANADTIKVILQREAQKDAVVYEATIAKLEKKEAELDEALSEARRVVGNQQRATMQLRQTTSKVNKIARDASK